MNTLVTIPFSHYCEKARWALDWCGVPYRERAFLPGAHLLATRRHGSPTVPQLLVEDGSVLTDSSDILRWADARAGEPRRLFAADAARRAATDALEDDFDERLGPATRLWAYAHGLARPSLLRALVAPSLPRARDRLGLRLLLPLVGPLIGRRYGATLARARAAEASIAAVFDEVSARLERRRYLEGDRFGAADLTFAALGGPLLLPPEHPSLASDVPLTAEMAAFVARLAATAAGRHATRMYREHRR